MSTRTIKTLQDGEAPRGCADAGFCVKEGSRPFPPVRPLRSLTLVLLASATLQAAPDRARFLEDRCYDCHDEHETKGDLRLDNLAFTPKDPANAKIWVRVLERVEDHEMPPRKKDQPSEAERAAFLAPLTRELLTAETARQKAEGRVVLRRLNRREYQNTMHDLLGVEVDLMGLLPEDSSAHGFDNIGEALTMSSVLMERYLAAADAALDAIFVQGPQPETKHWHVSMRPKNLRDVKDGKLDYRLARGARFLPDESLVMLSSEMFPLEKFEAPVEGHYRFKIHARAADHGGKPIALGFYGGSFDSRNLNTHLIGYYDVPEKETDIEFSEYLPRKGTIKPAPYRLGHQYLPSLEKLEAFQGPFVTISWIEVDGPLIESWPPTGYRHLLGEASLATAGLPEAEKAMRWLAARAFRRAIAPADLEPYLELVKSQLAAGQTFEQSLRAGLKGILCSPDFLFFRESAPAFDDYALAARLAYFLWSATPDEDLERVAAQGKIRQPAVLRAQVERLLRDPKAARFTDNFTGQWLGLRNLDFTKPDKTLYPEHDDALQQAMEQETKLFFNELLEKDLSITNFVRSDFTLLNERLARHYGIEGVEGESFRRVALKPEDHRGGLLTQAAILKVSANGTTTSPVIRGNWVLKNILGQPVKPPPPNTPAVEPDIRGAKTIREQIAKHRESEACATCHDRMDPLGLALENYDVIGGWRIAYRSLGEGTKVNVEVEGRRVGYKTGKPVDPSSVLPDGRPFADLAQLQAILLEQKAQLARGLAEKLLTYATGAGITFADRPAVTNIEQSAAKHGYGLRSLVHAVVESPAFLSK